eukprot:347649-Prymnesium_polylepis.1
MMTRLRSRVCPRGGVCVRLVPSAVFHVPRLRSCAEWRRIVGRNGVATELSLRPDRPTVFV